MDIDPVDIVKGPDDAPASKPHPRLTAAVAVEELAKATAVQLRLQSDGQPAMGWPLHPGGLVALLT